MKLKEFYHECRRVIKIMKKPTKIELKTIIKVSAISILIIGFIGFIIDLLIHYTNIF